MLFNLLQSGFACLLDQVVHDDEYVTLYLCVFVCVCVSLFVCIDQSLSLWEQLQLLTDRPKVCVGGRAGLNNTQKKGQGGWETVCLFQLNNYILPQRKATSVEQIKTTVESQDNLICITKVSVNYSRRAQTLASKYLCYFSNQLWVQKRTFFYFQKQLLEFFNVMTVSKLLFCRWRHIFLQHRLFLHRCSRTILCRKSKYDSILKRLECNATHRALCILSEEYMLPLLSSISLRKKKQDHIRVQVQNA